jgi:twitching motility protein PilT
MAAFPMAAVPPIFADLFALAVEHAASDLHLKVGRPALVRVAGQLVETEMSPFTAAQLADFIEATVPAAFRARWLADHQVDYSLDLGASGQGRYRVNAYIQRGQPALALRLVKSNPPDFAALNHEPKSLGALLAGDQGLVLVCGPTGSGKSSTLAAMLRHLNETEALHVITLEDPVEYLFTDRKCSFSQREVGIDVADFPAGLKAALRQDPDVILVGEMRDRETFETAVHASETGHLVLSTLHAGSAQQAVQRLFEFYPPEQLNLAKRSIAAVLRAVVVQTLVPRADGAGVLPACEVFVVDPLARRMLADGSFERIPELVEAGGDVGSRSLNKDLTRLIRAGLVTKETGLRVSANPKGLEMNLAGISFAGSRIVS